jgi:transcriptional regulator with XRE-family HTH domain
MVIRGEFSKTMSFGARLAEERKRLGLKQAEFAALVGTDVPKQSLYENDRRELRADYLARLADAEIDILYVLTGARMEGSTLSAQASDLLSFYVRLPEELQQALTQFAERLCEHVSPSSRQTLHSPRSGYRVDGDARR